MKKKKQIVEVLWTDSMSARGWRTQEEARELFSKEAIIHSVGYVFHRDKHKLALVGAFDHQQDEYGPNVNQYQEIPLSAIKSIRKVK